jgi:hypothetical protein
MLGVGLGGSVGVGVVVGVGVGLGLTVGIGLGVGLGVGLGDTDVHPAMARTTTAPNLLTRLAYGDQPLRRQTRHAVRN